MQMTSRRGFLQAAGTLSATITSAQQTPAPGARKAGYAVVGLGRLAQNQILPAFAKCRYSRVTALVSGDPAKAARLASQYGVNAKNIYNYETYDRLASSPDVQVIYIALPIGSYTKRHRGPHPGRRGVAGPEAHDGDLRGGPHRPHRPGCLRGAP